jgi:hypothetical protein
MGEGGRDGANTEDNKKHGLLIYSCRMVHCTYLTGGGRSQRAGTDEG